MLVYSENFYPTIEIDCLPGNLILFFFKLDTLLHTSFNDTIIIKLQNCPFNQI